jgi:GxxExxY protein
MNTEKADLTMKHDLLTDAVISCFYTVYGVLGYGFLEKVYENALRFEFEKRGIQAEFQFPIAVRYDGKVVGEYVADIVVNNCLIVEIKAVKCLLPEHESQLLNYLKATDIEVGLLLNFGPKAEIKRKVFDNDKK